MTLNNEQYAHAKSINMQKIKRIPQTVSRKNMRQQVPIASTQVTLGH